MASESFSLIVVCFRVLFVYFRVLFVYFRDLSVYFRGLLRYFRIFFVYFRKEATLLTSKYHVYSSTDRVCVVTLLQELC